MQPSLRNGQIVIGFGWSRKYKVGDIVVFQHENLEKIKRIHKITKQGVEVRGDNKEASTDSRTFGTIPMTSVSAKVICKLF